MTTDPTMGADLNPRARMKLPDLHNNPLIINIFYGCVLTTAAVGSGLAAQKWMGWPLLFALPAVLLGELAGIVLLQMADQRRRLGEQAYGARILSAVVASGMVLLNWFGHQDNPKAAGFFAGASALGYLVWVFHSGSRRRDQLRADKRLAETPPAYGLFRWLRHPFTTAEARQVAQQFPEMGLYGSLEVVRLRPVIRPWLSRVLTEVHGKESARFMIAIMDAKGMADMVRELVRFDVIARHLADTINAPYLGKAAPTVRAAPALVPAPAPAGDLDDDDPDDERQLVAAGRVAAASNGHGRPVAARVATKATSTRAPATRRPKADDDERVGQLIDLARGNDDGKAGVREAKRRFGWSWESTGRLFDLAEQQLGYSIRRPDPDDPHDH